MSETQDETQTEPEQPPTEPEIPLEEPAPAEPAEPEPPAEPTSEPPGAHDDRDIEAIYGRLDARAANYIKSASEIVGDVGVPLDVCEMGQDAYPGLRWREQLD